MKKDFKGKSSTKRKAEGTQEFFDKSKKGTQSGFTFSKAPLNKDTAKAQLKSTFTEGKHFTQKQERTRSAFISNLYKDDAELDELKVIQGADFDSELEGGSDSDGGRKRDSKSKRKTENKGGFKGFATTEEVVDVNKIGRLKLTKGSVALFAVSEVHEGKYAIVNHTRNVKGYLSLGAAEGAISLKVGQLVVASVIQEGTGKHNVQTSGNLNRKLQLSLEPKAYNYSIKGETVTEGMMLQAMIESRESKGYMLNLGFKDKAAGFLKFSEDNPELNTLEAGELVHVIVGKSANAKVLKCEMVGKSNFDTVTKPVNRVTDEKVTLHTLRPGFLVDAKLTKVVDNGIWVSFLSGLTGTIFVDHLKKNHKYKVGEKVKARVISVDTALKRVCLSLLPHLVGFTQPEELPVIGQFYENAKVLDIVFGSSFTVKLTDKLNGFLHKSHVGEIDDESEKEEEETKVKKSGKKKMAPKKTEADSLLSVDQVLLRVRVKEVNHFDGMPMISMRKDILEGVALDYSQLTPGQFVKATIKSVNEKGVTLKLNEFVEGQLILEHMGEMPCQRIPPKYQQVDKEIKVRVFSVDNRMVLFTKKDTLMKEKTPLHDGDLKSIQKGSKVVGVVVGVTEYGFIVRSFGDIKGLLTYKDLEENKTPSSQFKPGSMVKAYVLFNKKKAGLALTLNKKKALAAPSEPSTPGAVRSTRLVEDSFEAYLPDADEAKKLKKTYKTILSKQDVDKLVGKSFTFKIAEEKSNYYIVKSSKSEGKATRVVGIVPKCLAQTSGIALPLSRPDFRCEGLVLEDHVESGLAVISLQPELELLKDKMPASAADFKQSGQRLFLGFIGELCPVKGATVRFMNGFTRLISLKDSGTSTYKIGQVVRVGLNKLDRPTLKQQVVALADPAQARKDREIQLHALSTVSNLALNAFEIRVGMKVTATVQMVKEYGLIVAIDKYSELTGFIVNEQKLSPDKKYKEGQNLECIVLDCDTGKAIVDLSERLVSAKKDKEESKSKQQSEKAFVEVVKDKYLVVTLKSNRRKVAACILHPFNNENDASDLYQKYSVGEQIDIKLVESTAQGFLLAMPKGVDAGSLSGVTGTQNTSLEEGYLVTGTLRSVKGHCLYIHVGQLGSIPLIGRLHRIECNKVKEFGQFKVGDKIQAKVLKMSKENDKTWIELTRREEHLKHKDGLDQDKLRFLSFDTMPEGQPIEAMITEVTNHSCPISVAVSPFIHSQIFFSDCVSAQDLKADTSTAKFVQMKYKVGQLIKVIYFNDGRFVEESIANSTKQIATKGQRNYTKGDLVMVRFVKSVKSFGITVQLDQKTYGNISLCEITDKQDPNMLGTMQEKRIFIARVIDHDKKGRLQLCSRESITDQSLYSNMDFEGTNTAKFQEADQERQDEGNLRNKILKFGAAVAVDSGALVSGYVTGISKVGCFIQLGHNTCARAALTELSDEANFDFSSKMANGMLVIGRITKKENEAKLSMSLRRSLVIYGVGQITRSKLEVQQEHTVVILAVAADAVCFGQIKGSYHRLKIKGAPTSTLKIGELCQVKLSKIEKQKIVAEYIQMTPKSEEVKEVQLKEANYSILFEKVQKTARDDLKFLSQPDLEEKEETKIETIFKKQTDYEQQIADLAELNAIDDEEMKSADADADSDSDADLVQKIITDSKKYDQMESDEEEEDSQEEEGEADMEEDEVEAEAEAEASDEEMVSAIDEDSSEESASDKGNKKKKSGKQALKAQMTVEKEIRKKEAAMRNEDGEGAQNLDINDYERLLVGDKDQSFLWIQYMAFVLDKLDIEAARRIAKRAVKSVNMTNDSDKLNIWIAYMNMESQFGTQQSLEECVKGALEVNDRQKVYLQLISIYRQSDSLDFIEPIYKKLCKKYNGDVEIWAAFIQFLVEMAETDDAEQFTPAKVIFTRSLQALPRASHINIISKYGMLEFKHGRPESGRTMFEGVISNFPKRMDIWSIYMDMEVKYGAGAGKKNSNVVQARHLFERALKTKEITAKAKKMKLVFRKYMEYESSLGNNKQLKSLQERVEEYLEKTFKAPKAEAEAAKSEESGSSSNEESGDEEEEEEENSEMTD